MWIHKIPSEVLKRNILYKAFTSSEIYLHPNILPSFWKHKTANLRSAFSIWFSDRACCELHIQSICKKWRLLKEVSSLANNFTSEHWSCSSALAFSTSQVLQQWVSASFRVWSFEFSNDSLQYIVQNWFTDITMRLFVNWIVFVACLHSIVCLFQSQCLGSFHEWILVSWCEVSPKLGK